MLSLIAISFLGCGNIGDAGRRAEYYAHYAEDAVVDWNEKIEIYHYWRNLDFIPGMNPSKKQVKEWENICERAFVPGPTERRYVQGNFTGMNQYVTANDLIEVLHGAGATDKMDDGFILWRLAQYDTAWVQIGDPIEKVDVLKGTIDRLLDYEADSQLSMNLQCNLKRDLQEFYARRLLQEAIDLSDEDAAAALLEEDKAWQTYHQWMIEAYIKLEESPDGFNGSSWPMAVAELALDNLSMRIGALEDYIRIMTDTPLSYEDYCGVGQGMIMHLADDFMGGLKESDCNHTLQERKACLDREVGAFIRWMNTRTSVEQLLPGDLREKYAFSTSALVKHKYIMMKNRYQGYGIVGEEILECLIPYDPAEEELYGPDFEEKWMMRFEGGEGSPAIIAYAFRAYRGNVRGGAFCTNGVCTTKMASRPVFLIGSQGKHLILPFLADVCT